MQRLVDNVLAVTKESVKTITYESLNNIVRLINGVSALLLALLPGKTSLLEGIHGWELRPTFRGPRLPRWMEKGSKVPTTAGSLQPSHLRTIRRAHSNKDHVVQRATDRRRGVIEDLHLAIEIFIEAVFDVVHKAARCLLSPLDTFRTLLRWFSSRRSSTKYGGLDASVATATLAENDPTPTGRKTSYQHSMNTDARTCRDVITELGYPYEAISVITADGYVLLLERIPSWVSNGVVGSPAFAAFDQGYDVFLGNLRGLVSREHVDKNISSRQYWHYSINEHGMEDIPAMIEKIHEVKMSELKSSEPDTEEESNSHQPYKLSAICHSLGGAAILMYVITRRIEEKPHRLSRLILLSPAGFHDDSTFVFTMVEYITLWLAPILAPLVPGFYIPTRFLRMLLNKLARDFHNNPAVGGLVQTLIGYVTGGDSSNWVGVIGLPHYNMNDMPGVSFRVGLHLAQMKHAGKFIMFDYGSAAANMEIYGSPEPLDLGEYYGLIDVPVDLVAGRKDKVILPSMVRKHYKLMKDSGVEVSFNEFEYAHLDFTFSHREELLAYVMSRLLLVAPPQKHKSLRLKKKDGQGNC
ncbi:hypothetical protein RJ639_020900 [Escallonia herrerae]|uniref:Uncharacterized protein n=1 Tax=Escallonia herrerae TaxID=1293975 RepID=A0AA89AFL5_9ASTE|nr:hypothetical protein RJ639_020900 [Escallonia herrerae]